MVKLSERLQIIYDMVPLATTVADVGCDHGYLSIALLQGGKAKKAIAMDVNKGPLESAKSNGNAAGLSSQMEFRLSDGIAKLSCDEADVICICGMGGALITRILSNGIQVARSAKAIIIEPQSEYRAVREFLVDNHFVILDEDLCMEEGKIYPIMKIAYDAAASISLTEAELEYGPVIIKKRPELFSKLLTKNKNEYMDIIAKLEKTCDSKSGSPIQKRKDELSNKIALIRELEA